MTELTLMLPEETLPSIVKLFQSEGTINNLLNDMSIYLQVMLLLVCI